MRMRAGISLSLIGAFFLAITLGSAPQLHERLHKVDPQHECAATLVAAGQYHHAAPLPVVSAPAPAPQVGLLAVRDAGVIRIAVPSSILEHAPPALI